MTSLRDYILDTNVLIIASGDANHATLDCQIDCISLVQAFNLLNEAGDLRLILDPGGLALEEYKANIRQGSFADEFLFNLLRKMYADEGFVSVSLAQNADEIVEAIPPQIIGFDPKDAKWLALACAYSAEHDGLPAVIAQAADTRWCAFRDDFDAHGICVTFLCALCDQQTATPS